MKTIRYYYSPDYRVVNADALVYKDVSIELLERKGKTKFLPRITVCGIYDHDTNELSIGVLDVLQKINLENLLEEKSRWTERKIIRIQ